HLHGRRRHRAAPHARRINGWICARTSACTPAFDKRRLSAHNDRSQISVRFRAELLQSWADSMRRGFWWARYGRLALRSFSLVGIWLLSHIARAADPAIVGAEFIFDTAPFAQCHASTIVQTPAGLVAAWFGGT